MVTMFDDLFLDQIVQNFFLFPILISICIGIFVRNVFLVLLAAIAFAVIYDIYAAGDRIVVQSLVAAAVAHSVGALAGFCVGKVVR